LFEQFAVGHSWGSSHGFSRITRSAYGDSGYVNLMLRANQEGWPHFEKMAGERLVYQNPGCLYGAGEDFEKYLQAAAGQKSLEILSLDEAKRRFPQFHFPGVTSVIQDHTAGVIAAQKVVQALYRQCLKQGVEMLEETKLLSFDRTQDSLILHTSRGTFYAKKAVITAGGWLESIIPALAARLTVIRQTVGYFQMSGPPETIALGHFPVWVYIGEGRNNLVYGLPEFGRKGMKIAQHLTAGPSDNPDALSEEIDVKAVEDLTQIVRQHFHAPIDSYLGAENCLYTNTASEDFIIDFLPDDRRILVGSICSGHGFKFAPLTGKILADLIVKGETAMPEYHAMQKRFRL
ncbi:MAG: FAD-dependent oxidoreductase, partial [Parachlamydia sp.]|nr:FAD-dependent oxidoreductase [Parachlamydia sp.]